MPSDELSVGELVPDATVEHTSVEVDTLVPAGQVLLPLLVNKGLVGRVVGVDSVLPPVMIEEDVSPLGHLLEVLVCIGAVSH